MSRGRLIPVRLSDVPPPVRLRAARKLVETAADTEETLSLLAAALVPSERVYWVRADVARADAA